MKGNKNMSDESKYIVKNLPDECKKFIVENTIFDYDKSERFELFVEQGLTSDQEKVIYKFIVNTIIDQIIFYCQANCSIADVEKYINYLFGLDTTEYQKQPYQYYGWDESSLTTINGQYYLRIKPVLLR